MHQIPPLELAVRISKIINRNRERLKDYQDNHGKVNFNILIGLVLGGICSFSAKPSMTIQRILQIFLPIFAGTQLQDYANLMMGLNNHLVDVLDSNPNNICVLENNIWTPIGEASVDSVYALWHAFFGVMKVEFEYEKDKIAAVTPNSTRDDALRYYAIMHEIMTSPMVDHTAMNAMYNKFPEYSQKFNELRKLMYLQTIKTQPTLH